MLLILRGVPGCGKSTFAEKWVEADSGRAIISRDNIRYTTFGKYTGVDERMVTKLEDNMLKELIRSNYSVVIDDTNIQWHCVTKFAKIAREIQPGIYIEIQTFDIPLEIAIAQNQRRFAKGGRFVPHDIIEKMHDKFEANKHLVLQS